MDQRLGVDTAPYSAESLTELSYPDLAFEALLLVGTPAPDALDMVLEAADAVGADRAICFALIMESGALALWPE